MRLIISINVNENKDFTLEGLKKKNFFREKFRFLPYPNDIAFKNNYFILGKNIKISTVDINPSHDLVKQFSRELAEDFNLSINFNDAKELSEIPEVPTFKKDRKKNKESYIIYTKKGKILLESKALHGLFNAFQTLRQILINGKRV